MVYTLRIICLIALPTVLLVTEIKCRPHREQIDKDQLKVFSKESHRDASRYLWNRADKQNHQQGMWGRSVSEQMNKGNLMEKRSDDANGIGLWGRSLDDRFPVGVWRGDEFVHSNEIQQHVRMLSGTVVRPQSRTETQRNKSRGNKAKSRGVKAGMWGRREVKQSQAGRVGTQKKNTGKGDGSDMTGLWGKKEARSWTGFKEQRDVTNETDGNMYLPNVM